MTNPEFVATVAWQVDGRDSSGRVSAEQCPGAKDTLAQQTDMLCCLAGLLPHARFPGAEGALPLVSIRIALLLEKPGRAGFNGSDCSLGKKIMQLQSREACCGAPDTNTSHHTLTPLFRAMCQL